jgi:hypothetical protein
MAPLQLLGVRVVSVVLVAVEVAVGAALEVVRTLLDFTAAAITAIPTSAIATAATPTSLSQISPSTPPTTLRTTQTPHSTPPTPPAVTTPRVISLFAATRRTSSRH